MKDADILYHTPKSDTICPFPWMHLHAWPDGKAMLCCIAHGGKNMGEVGDFSKNTFNEIINSDKLKQVRLDMMAGKKIEHCTACYDHEALPGNMGSFRQNTLKDYGQTFDELVDEMEPDGTLPNPKMMYVDFRFSNLCNLGCQTCGGQLSSTLANMDKKAGFNKGYLDTMREKNVLSERETITSFVYARPDFLEVDVFPHMETIRGFYFAGGEPLMSPEHLSILQYLDEHEMYDKTLIYSTNMSILKWKQVEFLPIWEKFKNLRFFCSIDGQGKTLEYVREFSKHDTVFGNLQKLLDFKHSNTSLIKQRNVTIIYTHSIYNCYNTAEFFEFLDAAGMLEKLDQVTFNPAFGETNSPECLPDFAKEELRQKRKEDLNNPSVQKAFKLFPDFAQYWHNVDDTINKPRNEKDFKISMEKISSDAEKFKKHLPWLYSVNERQYIL